MKRYKFRDTPKDLNEMLAWGMINIRVYDKVKHLPFEKALSEINDNWGTQTWWFGEHHYREYISDMNIDVKSFTINEWVKRITIETNGRCSFDAIHKIYEEYTK